MTRENIPRRGKTTLYRLESLNAYVTYDVRVLCCGDAGLGRPSAPYRIGPLSEGVNRGALLFSEPPAPGPRRSIEMTEPNLRPLFGFIDQDEVVLPFRN